MDQHTWVSQEIIDPALQQLQEEVFGLTVQIIGLNVQKPVKLNKCRIGSMALQEFHGMRPQKDTFFMAQGDSFFFICPNARITGVYLPKIQCLYKVGADEFILQQAKQLLTEILADPYQKK